MSLGKMEKGDGSEERDGKINEQGSWNGCVAEIFWVMIAAANQEMLFWLWRTLNFGY